MSDRFQTAWALVRSTVRKALDDDVPSLSAAIAYYTIFSLPSLMVILVGLAGVVFGVDLVEDALLGQARDWIGPEGGQAVREMIQNAGSLGEGTGAKLAGVAVLFLGAAGAFGQLQKALNRAWNAEKSEGGFTALLLKRLVSFGVVLTIVALLFVSLAVSAVLSSFGEVAASALSSGVADGVLQILHEALTLGIVTTLFAALFKMLPDVDIRWKSVWTGALVTALLFTVGKAGIGVYLGTANPGSAFGAAGALALILVWIYYSSLIVLVGAEFTYLWAMRAEQDLPTNAETE